MPIDPKLIEELLYSEEDATLDFKQSQYSFERAGKESKSELLKDILAFVNGFRRVDAYILIGVEEVRGGRSRVVGVQKQLDDAKLQQFVNSKTQLPVTFSYQEAIHDELPIGVIHIPIQTRPIYTNVDFGKVSKETVYIRRGSSTGTAKPEEIIQMGMDVSGSSVQPTVKLYLVNPDAGVVYVNPIQIEEPTWFDTPPRNRIPDYHSESSAGSAALDTVLFNTDNRDFYRELAVYLQTVSCFKATLELENTSGQVIQDASIVLELMDPDNVFELLGSNDRPTQPNRHNLHHLNLMPEPIGLNSVFVSKEGQVWKAECRFGKIRPREKVRLNEDLLIGSRNAGEVQITGSVYADNIATPISVGFTLFFKSASRTLSAQDLVDANRNIGRLTKQKKQL